jgi:predicted metal-dependent phosphoesterase TrpH
MPFDCGVRMEDQLQAVLERGLDVLFVTNHNTLDGYRQIREYQDNHSRFKSIKIYPAEEITIDNKGHVLAYGIYKTIKSGMSLEETLDEVRSQNGISCAAHPFAVSNGIRDRARLCDMIESFNSNNVDHFSNIVASRFAKSNGLPTIAGSDSHVLATLGKCTNAIESENNLDSIIHCMSKGKVKIIDRQYASKTELFQHAHYIISSSQQMILSEAREQHPKFAGIMRWALNSYLENPNGLLWRSISSFALYLAGRVSKKINMNGYDSSILLERSWKKLITLGMVP